MGEKAKKTRTAKCQTAKKKWARPNLKEHRLQDDGPSGFDEILLAPNDPAVT